MCLSMWSPPRLCPWSTTLHYVHISSQNPYFICFVKSPSVCWRLEMHDEIFRFEIFKKIHEIFETFQDPFFMIFLIFNIKWLKTFKNITKVYQVSRRYIMLIMLHNNKYLPLTGLLTLLQRTIQPALHSPSSGKIFRYLWCEMTSVGPYVTPVVVCAVNTAD